MICEGAKELLPAYVIGSLESREVSALEEHVRDCPECKLLYSDLETVLEYMPFAAEDVLPPPEIKERLFSRLSLADREPADAGGPLAMTTTSVPAVKGAPRWMPGWTSAASLAAVIVLAVWVGALQARLGLLEEIEAQARSAVEEQMQVLERGAVSATLVKGLEGTPASPNAKGIMLVSPTEGKGLLVVFGLDPLPEGQAYQLWLIRDGERASGGVFSVNDRGYGMLAVEAPVPLANFQSVGITNEPKGGSPGPTGKKVLGGEL